MVAFGVRIPTIAVIMILAILFLLAAEITGCSVRLTAQYDAIIDQSATGLQGKIETFLIKMERTAGTAEGEYAGNTGFYDEIQGALCSLELRAKVLPKNEAVSRQLGLLLDSLERLRQIHQRQGKHGLTNPLVTPVRDTFNSQFKAILILENTLKRGKTSAIFPFSPGIPAVA